MGAVFFMMFLAFVFLIALGFIVLSVALIVVWRVRKRRGKAPRKWWLALAVVLLAVNALVALVPIGYVGFLRVANGANRQEAVQAPSGKAVYWPLIENGSTTSWFELDGVKYVPFRAGFSDDRYFLDYTADKLEEPVANIFYSRAGSNPFNDFMWVLLSGRTYADQNISTVYPVRNDNGFAICYVENSPGSASLAGGTYCAERDQGAIKAYYSDMSNYDTQNLVSKYAVYAAEGEKGTSEHNGAPYLYKKKPVTLRDGAFETLFGQFYDEAAAPIAVPETYRGVAPAPGAPIFGYDDCDLYAYSADGLVYRFVALVLIDGRVYVEKGSSGGVMNGQAVPDDMNQYIIDSVFN